MRYTGYSTNTDGSFLKAQGPYKVSKTSEPLSGLFYVEDDNDHDLHKISEQEKSDDYDNLKVLKKS